MSRALATLSLVALNIVACSSEASAEAVGECGATRAESVASPRAPLGYSVGNFGISAAISENGLKIDKSLINPPVLGQWLQPLGSGELIVNDAHSTEPFVCERRSVFPENRAEVWWPASQLRAHVDTFAPIGSIAGEATSINNFIPTIVIQIDFTNEGSAPRELSAAYEFRPLKPGQLAQFTQFTHGKAKIAEAHSKTGDGELWLMAVPDVSEGASTWHADPSASSIGNILRLKVHITLAPHQPRSLTFVLGAYDHRGYAAARLPSRHATEEYLLAQGLKSLKRQQSSFVAALPRTGDPELDLYTRWYLSAAVLLTKGLATGEVLTMGYRELNQRDSFWASGVHLVYWPDLELKMLRESMSFQQADGHIPLTILPVIERDNNIDGNEYFILRVIRYYEWTRDPSFLAEALPHVRRAVEFLKSLDREKVGIPKQVSYWADWKDVPGVEGRTYAPHFSLLWLAALKGSRELALAASDTAWAAHLRELYAIAEERVNRDVSEGGLWMSTHYVDRWNDGRKTPYVLQDQAVAGVFGVIPHDRLESIYAQLDGTNESGIGVRETYPYIPEFKQDYGAGEYHNGGVWPWLNFADAWGRFLNGHASDAERIMKKVAYHDLVCFNDFLPSEFLQGESGKNMGFDVQGWDADWFSAIYFGAFGLERVSGDELAIHLNLSNRHDFRTAIRIPEGTVWIIRANGQISTEQALSRPLQIRMP